MTTYIYSFIKRWYKFIIAFLIMFLYLFRIDSLIATSQDAAETWNVAKTFFSAEPAHSYVMYKGLWAIFPNVIFYQLAQFFGTDEFLFVKLFNSILFAYITAIGIPYFLGSILGKKIEDYKVLLVTGLIFLMVRPYFTFISVDALSVAALLLATNCAIKIGKKEIKKSLFFYTMTGSIIALVASFSGQYSLSAICIFVYILSKSNLKSLIKGKRILAGTLAISLCFVLGFSMIKGLDQYYVETRVQPVRDAGEWLPEGKVWLQYALTSNLMLTKMPPSIPDNRGTAILTKEGANISVIQQGGVVYSFKEIVALMFKYPLDYIVRWLNRLFLGISLDNYRNSFSYLFISYTALYLSLLAIMKRCIYLKNILQIQTLLIIAWILPSLIPSLMHVELRYYMALQILIFSIAVYNDIIWDSFRNHLAALKSVIIKNNNSKLPMRVNYTFLAYLVFVSLCFMIYATQNELLGPDPSILFTL